MEHKPLSKKVITSLIDMVTYREQDNFVSSVVKPEKCTKQEATNNKLMRTKAWRRHQEEKKKSKIQKIFNFGNWWSLNDDDSKRLIGVRAHSPKLCSCWMCGNPRKYFNEMTIQEKRNS